MKTFKELYDDSRKVTIIWTKPVKYESGKDLSGFDDGNAFFYKILAKYSNKPIKLVYIGKVFQRNVSNRLKDPDHQKRLENLNKQYPNHHLFISQGVLEHKRFNEKTIDDLESLLIYSHSNDDFDLINKKKIWKHNVRNSYQITNINYRSGMYRVVTVGVFYNK